MKKTDDFLETGNDLEKKTIKTFFFKNYKFIKKLNKLGAHKRTTLNCILNVEKNERPIRSSVLYLPTK